ncbi:MAG: hypothetical protein JJ868_16495 [Shimia sp.]|uniref:hypothetical protein n=1 Tax=Shimia sp. TaxID=1954381 RepID=UPI001AFF66F4|nr:hypothetical protein [Shimia sp.]MBO6898971.1 hypothetical protein [Shimia sp.]
MTIAFGSEDNVIASFAPIHNAWEPIVVVEDCDEVIVYYGAFTHKHYGYFGEKTDPESEVRSVVNSVIEDLISVFEDRLEFYKFFGGGGARPGGTQKGFSKALFGKNGVVWSGKQL